MTKTTFSDLLQGYYAIKKEIERLEKHKKDFETEIFEQFKLANIQKYQAPHGTYSIVKRSSYKYSNLVDEMSQQLRSQKEKEEKDGVAAINEKEFLRFQEAKE